MRLVPFLMTVAMTSAVADEMPLPGGADYFTLRNKLTNGRVRFEKKDRFHRYRLEVAGDMDAPRLHPRSEHR